MNFKQENNTPLNILVPSENEKDSRLLTSYPPVETRPPYVPERIKPTQEYNEGCTLQKNPIIEDDDPELGYRFGNEFYLIKI